LARNGLIPGETHDVRLLAIPIGCVGYQLGAPQIHIKKQKHIDVIGSTTTGCVWYISASANLISDPDLIRVIWQGSRLRLEE
jgi:hypothetical protein